MRNGSNLYPNPIGMRIKNPEAAGPRGAKDSDYFRAAIGSFERAGRYA